MNAGYGFVASGNILPSRFVAGVSSQPFYIEQGTASKRLIGVSDRGTYYAPGTAADSGYAIPDGKSARVWQDGEEALIKCGGTINAFDFLTADASGQAVSAAASTALQYFGAVAMQDGADGQFIRVKVKCFEAVTA